MITTNSKRLRMVTSLNISDQKSELSYLYFRFLMTFFITIAFTVTTMVVNNYLLKCDSALDLFHSLGFC